MTNERREVVIVEGRRLSPMGLPGFAAPTTEPGT
jgi:hypothetical protein